MPESRLRRLRNGNVAVDLKRAWARGTTSLEFEPLAFIARLAALMPPPGMKLCRFLGVIAPHAALRPFVLPTPPPVDSDEPTAPARPARMTWSDLLARVLALDVNQCGCGGRFRFIAAIDEPTAIEAVAAAIIASGHLPRHRAPRGPPSQA